MTRVKAKTLLELWFESGIRDFFKRIDELLDQHTNESGNVVMPKGFAVLMFKKEFEDAFSDFKRELSRQDDGY